MTVIPYSRWLTTAKPLHQGHSFKNTPKLVPSCRRHRPQPGIVEMGYREGGGSSVIFWHLCHLLPPHPFFLGAPGGFFTCPTPLSARSLFSLPEWCLPCFLSWHSSHVLAGGVCVGSSQSPEAEVPSCNT